MYNYQRSLICILIFILLLTGCASLPTNQTATALAVVPPTASSTPLPTKPPTATATSTVTATASPSPTFTPTATMTIAPPGDPVATFVDGVKITAFDGFESVGAGEWELVSERVVIEDGMVQLGSKIYRDTRLINHSALHAGEGVIFDFMFTSGSQVYAYLDYSLFIKNDYKRFGVETGLDTRTNIRNGIELMPPVLLVGNLTPKPDTWYSMLLAVDEGAEMLVLIWNPENPAARIRNFGNYKESWENLPWQFAVSINKGNMVVDNFRRFTFEDINLP